MHVLIFEDAPIFRKQVHALIDGCLQQRTWTLSSEYQCHKQQSYNWTCPIVVCDTFVCIMELVAPIGLVPLLFATLGVDSGTCPVVVCSQLYPH